MDVVCGEEHGLKITAETSFYLAAHQKSRLIAISARLVLLSISPFGSSCVCFVFHLYLLFDWNCGNAGCRRVFVLRYIRSAPSPLLEAEVLGADVLTKGMSIGGAVGLPILRAEEALFATGLNLGFFTYTLSY